MIKKIIAILSIVLLTAVSGTLDIYAKAKYSKSIVEGDSKQISLELNKKAFKIADEAIIINEKSVVDAISVTPLAYAKNAPVIVLEWKGINKETREYIKELGVKKVTIIGNWSAISNTTELELIEMGIEVNRIYGENRYETSRMLSSQLLDIKSSKEAFLISDDTGLENAISIYSYAAQRNIPIVWTSDTSLLHARYYFKRNGIEKVYVIGSSEKFISEVERMKNSDFVNEVEFIEEINIYNSNIDTIRKFQKGEIDQIYLENMQFGKKSIAPEMISLGVVSAKENIPILISGESLSYAQDVFINKNDIEDVIQIGTEVKNYSLINTITAKNFVLSIVLIAFLTIILVRGFKYES